MTYTSSPAPITSRLEALIDFGGKGIRGQACSQALGTLQPVPSYALTVKCVVWQVHAQDAPSLENGRPKDVQMAKAGQNGASDGVNGTHGATTPNTSAKTTM